MKKLIISLLALGIFGAFSLSSYRNYRDKAKHKSVASATIPELQATPIIRAAEEKNRIVGGWQPDQACDFLADTEYFPTRNHMKYSDFIGDGKFMCASKEFELPSNPYGLPNDLSYRVLGTKTSADTLKLVLDLHRPTDKSAGYGTAILISNANKLSLKATAGKLPEGIPQALLAHQSATVQSGGFTHQVKRQDYPNGSGGYEIHYILTRQSEKKPNHTTQSHQTDGNQAKTDLVRKLYLVEMSASSNEYLLSIATPELRKMIRQFDRFNDKTGCDMYPHYYLGLGNGDTPDDLQKTLQIKTVSPNTLRATFKDFDGKRVGADITMRCENGRCLIDDIKTIGDKTSMRTDFQTVLRKQSC